MAEFHRHPDGLVYVRGASAEYVDTPEHFQVDFGVTLAALPAGANEQVYSQGRRHAFMKDGSVVDGGSMPWSAGDAIIAGLAAGIAAQVVRTAVPPVEISLAAYAAAARWQKETGGITVAGIPIATDDRSKQMLLGARVAADADPEFETAWVGDDGQIYDVNAAQIIAISNAVLAHVAACFATYATVKAGIDAETITATAQIDAAFA